MNASKEPALAMKESAGLSSKAQLLFCLFFLVLLSMAFAAGVLVHSVFFPSRCETSSGEASTPRPHVCLTRDDFVKLVENSTAPLKSPQRKDPPRNEQRRTLLRRDPANPNAQMLSGTENVSDLKDVIIATLTAQLNRTLTEILLSRMPDCATGGRGKGRTERPAIPTTAEPSTAQTGVASTTPTMGNEVDHASGSGTALPEDKFCPEGWSRDQDSCYVIDNGAPSQDWERASRACHQLNSSLVSISSARENDFVKRLAQRKAPSYAYLWLGLHRTNAWEPFKWREGEPAFLYQNWAAGEPNNKKKGENCVHMYLTSWGGRAGKWNDEKCQYPSNGGPMVYACEAPAVAAPAEVSGEPDSSASGEGSENLVSPEEDDIYIWYGN